MTALVFALALLGAAEPCRLIDGHVFDAAETAAVFGKLLPGPYFTPTVCEAAAVEAALPKALAAAAAKTPRWSADRTLPPHKKQYFGYTEGGKRHVYVNGFCIDAPAWKERPVVVTDGGVCFFTGRFDLEAKTFAMLRFHGEG